VPLHVYGVTRADVALPDELQGLYDGPVTSVAEDGLAALVTECPDAPIARRAELMAHAQVLEQVVETETVLPMQFGMCMPDDQTVRHELLVAHRPRLGALLDQLDGTVQLTVKVVYREDDALREVLHRSPRLLEMRERLASIPPDAAHFKRADFGQEIAAELGRMGSRDGGEILGALTPLSLAHAEGRLLSPYQILNTAFLVRRESRTRFDEAVGAVAKQWEELGTVRYLGPQPPYSFVDLEAGDPAWA
jgi:Gas vesicle synthesis protein GvpL/GvpF